MLKSEIRNIRRVFKIQKLPTYLPIHVAINNPLINTIQHNKCQGTLGTLGTIPWVPDMGKPRKLPGTLLSNCKKQDKTS